MKIYDVAVIGGGVIGCEICRYLTAKSQSVVLLEKEGFITEGGATKANSGIVHAGFDCHVGTLKAKVNVRGSKLYPELCKRLGVSLVNCGALVIGGEADKQRLEALKAQGETNGVEGLDIIERSEILKYLPTAAENIKYALRAKTSAVISPYGVTIAMAEEAALNGAKFVYEYEVTEIKKNNGVYELSNGREVYAAKVVINAAGAGSKRINEIAKAEQFDLTFRRGEYMLLDLSEKDFVKATIFPLPTALGKGVLISPTAAGNVILGPTAIDCDAEETVVSSEGLNYIREQTALMATNVNMRKNIRVFSGVRVISGDDFIIEKSKKCDNYIYLGGICSPGLSSAPAIAEMVAGLCEECGLKLTDKKDIVYRKPHNETRKMTDEQLNALIKTDARYGKIVCRCEKITEGEIVEAIHSPLKPRTVDAIKKIARAGMGRCQGGFCMPSVMEILARELNEPIESVTKYGKGSEILVGKIKEDRQ